MEGVNDDDVALNPWPHHNFTRRRFTVSHSPPIVVNPYCGCVTRSRSSRANLRWLWGCKCGEELTAKVMWRWSRPVNTFPNDRNAVNLSYGDTAVVFYSQFSNGTAILRGTKLMREGIHFWEVKMISPVYGTDLMLGIGTPEVDLNMYRQSFRSALGLDERSWGLSFRGKIQHRGEWRHYAPEFGQGSIVGILLDLWHGTLTFYLNKRPLNVAFTGLTPSKTGYYAMVSSTAARTGVRLIRAESHSVSLQYLSLLKIRKSVHDPASILNLVSMPPGLQTFINNNLSYLIYPSPADMQPQQRSLIYGYTPSRLLHRPALAEASSSTNSSGDNSGRDQGRSSSSPDPEGGESVPPYDDDDDDDEDDNNEDDDEDTTGTGDENSVLFAPVEPANPPQAPRTDNGGPTPVICQVNGHDSDPEENVDMFLPAVATKRSREEEERLDDASSDDSDSDVQRKRRRTDLPDNHTA